MVRNPEHINQAFTEFYKTLYSSQGEKKHDTNRFLNSLDLPRMPEETQTGLEDKISEQEVLDALTRLPGGKAPGPDGFTMTS